MAPGPASCSAGMGILLHRLMLTSCPRTYARADAYHAGHLDGFGACPKAGRPFQVRCGAPRRAPFARAQIHEDEEKLSELLKPSGGQNALPYSLMAEAIKDGNPGRPRTIITAIRTYSSEVHSICLTPARERLLWATGELTHLDRHRHFQDSRRKLVPLVPQQIPRVPRPGAVG